jgi:type VI secretion system secreted protein VgrG
VTYRPLRKIPRKIVEGVQTAAVVGPSGDDIYFDQFGRVKIQFHWDREGQKNENSSCWIRVSDGYAGQNHGIQFTPLIGDEVIVDFLEGDPDRPIVTGRVYNGDNRPNLEPQNRIQNQILTPYQHKLLFDDRNAEILLKTGGNERITMQDGSKDSEIGNHIHIDTADSHKIHLNGGQHPQIGIQTQAKNQMVFDDEFKKISIWTTNGHSAEFDDDAAKITIQSAKGNRIIIDDNNNSITAIDSTDQHKIQIAADGQKITISTDTGSIDILAPSGTITMNAGSINMSAGSITETASGDINLKAANINAKTNADFNVDAGGQVNLKSGGPTNIKSGPTMDIKAGGVLTIQGSLVKIN